MRESLYHNDHPEQPLRPGKLNPLLAVLDYEARHPQGNEYILAGFAAAVKEELSQSIGKSVLADVINESLYFRRELNQKPLKPSQLMNNLFRAHQKQLLRTPELEYPHERFTTSPTWRKVFQAILSSHDGSREELEYDLAIRDNMGDVDSRDGPIKLALMAEHERLGEHPSRLDIACSAMTGPRKTLLNLPFDHVDVIGHPKATSKVNDMLATPLELGPTVGVDPVRIITEKNKILDDKNVEWVNACSFRGFEFRSERYDRFQELLRSWPDNAYFHVENFTKKGMSTLDESSPITKFDVVTCKTFLYMLSKRQVEFVQRLARQFVNPNGIIMYQDFATTNYSNESQLVFFDRWNDFTYRTFIEYPEDPTHKLHEVLKSKNGRSTELRFGRDIGKTALGTLLSP